MYDLALNVDSWDLVFHNNDLLLIDNAERIGQQIKITLQFWFQEWFLDTTQGIPYLQYICIKTPICNTFGRFSGKQYRVCRMSIR